VKTNENVNSGARRVLASGAPKREKIKTAKAPTVWEVERMSLP